MDGKVLTIARRRFEPEARTCWHRAAPDQALVQINAGFGGAATWFGEVTADEGATIVTHQSNKAFLERMAKTPHTLNPDRLSTSKKSVKIQTFGAKGTLTDGTRTTELHLLTNYEHTGDMLVVYLPKEEILAEPDAFTAPATPTTPLVVTAVPYAVALYDNIKRLQLDVKTIAPLHGARMTDGRTALIGGRWGPPHHAKPAPRHRSTRPRIVSFLIY